MTDAWKSILSLAVLAAPLAYCEAEDSKAREERHAREIEACFEANGMWSNSWRGYCEREFPND